MQRIINFSIIAAISLITFGCAGPYRGTLRFEGPGTYQDFAQARYQCIQQSSSRISGAVVIQYGGASQSRVGVDCSVMDACLGAKGYYRNPNGQHDSSQIAVSCQ